MSWAKEEVKLSDLKTNVKNGVISIKAPCLVCRKFSSINIVETRSATIANYKRHVSRHVEKPKLHERNSEQGAGLDVEQTQEQTEVSFSQGDIVEARVEVLGTKMQRSITSYLKNKPKLDDHDSDDSDCELRFQPGNLESANAGSTQSSVTRRTSIESANVGILEDFVPDVVLPLHPKN